MSGSPTLALLKGNSKASTEPAAVHAAGGGEDLFPPDDNKAEADELLGGETKPVKSSTEVQVNTQSPQADAPSAPKKKAIAKKTKNDLTVVTDAINGDVLGPDPLTTAAHEIENLSAAEAHAMISDLSETTDFNAFKLGGVLAKIFAEKWFVEYGYEDFKSYVEGTHGFKLRKAHYLVNIYNKIISIGLPWSELKAVGGWSKLKELTDIITPENAQEWLDKAKGMTVLQLHQLVQAAKNEGQVQLEGESKTNPTITKSFKLHADQAETVTAALDKAMKAGSTDIPSVALEYMALDYLANSEKAVSAGAEIDGPANPMIMAPDGVHAIPKNQPFLGEEITEEATSVVRGYLAKMGWQDTFVLVEANWPQLSITIEAPDEEQA